MPGSFTIQRSAKEEKLFELKACPGVCPGAFNKASTIHFSHDMKQIAIQLCNGIELDQVVHTHRTYRRRWTVDGSEALYTNSQVVTMLHRPKEVFVSSGFSEDIGLWGLLSLAGSQNLPYTVIFKEL